MRPRSCLLLTIGPLLLLSCGCGRPADGSLAIRNEGSDTMVNIAEAWAEQYHREHPNIRVQVLGGGSGVGIASLIDGNCDMANTSRKMKKAEIDAAQEAAAPSRGKSSSATMPWPSTCTRKTRWNQSPWRSWPTLYGEGGQITRWSQLGVPEGTLGTDQIIRVNRQSSSGTYAYFREAVLGKGHDLKLASIDANGSKDAVSLVSHTPSAIGYSGMGYATPAVKTLKVSKRRGEPGVAPTVENARNGSYPITRPLLIYTVGDAGRSGEGLLAVDSFARRAERRTSTGLRAGQIGMSINDVSRKPDQSARRQRDADRVRRTVRVALGRPGERLDCTEPAIEWMIRLCGWSAILFVFAIFFFVFREAAPMLFGKLNLVEFFTSTAWRPTSESGRNMASWRCWWARWP